MKVSEAIGKLKIGDTVWVKLKADGFDDIGAPLKVASPVDYDYMWLHEEDEISLTEPQAEKVEAHLAEHWNEDVGNVLWWNFPVEEPPYCGTPLDDDFPKYKTHFTELHMPDEVEEDPLYTVTFNLDLNYHLALDEGDGDDEISTTLTTGRDVLGYRYFLTEKEIKAIDERYWPFAVPVEEVVEG